MNIKTGILVFTSILCHVHSISARGNYYVDDTCQGTTRQFVLQEINSAIQRADNASLAVGSPAIQPTPTVRTFINWLFAVAPITSLYTTYGGGGGSPIPNVGIKNLVYNAGPASEAGQFDVIFSCDLSSWEESSEGDVPPDTILHWDTVINAWVGTSPVSMYDNCVNSNVDGSTTFALTTTRVGSGAIKKYSSHISLCPPALAQAQRALYADVATIPQGFAQRLTAWLSRNPATPVAIDNLYLYESGILHELTHTFPGGLKDDVRGLDSYGWAAMRDISIVAGDEGAENNADSYAYLALAIDLNNDGIIVNIDGSLE